MIETLRKGINRGECPQLDKKHLQKPITNIILNSETLNGFS